MKNTPYMTLFRKGIVHFTVIIKGLVVKKIAKNEFKNVQDSSETNSNIRSRNKTMTLMKIEEEK